MAESGNAHDWSSFSFLEERKPGKRKDFTCNRVVFDLGGSKQLSFARAKKTGKESCEFPSLGA